MLTEQLQQLEQTLWQTADTLRANSDLKSSEYSIPVLGIIFPRFADIPKDAFGDMFVQSAKFIEERRNGNFDYEDASLYVYGQEKTLETVKLAKMNLAVNGLRGEIHQANTYYEDPVDAFEHFGYVLANPPFNVDDVTLARVERDRRFNEYGVPRNKTKNIKKGEETCPNGNYLWINLFATSLNASGRAALVMANSASGARYSEAEIRKQLIESNLIYGMLTLPSNMFYTVTLSATLWFFDKAVRHIEKEKGGSKELDIQFPQGMREEIDV